MKTAFPRRIALAERSAAFAGPIFEVACPGPAPAHRPFAVAAAVAPRRPDHDPRPGRVAGSEHVHVAARRSSLGRADRDDPSRLIVTFRPGTTPPPARDDAGHRRATDDEAAAQPVRGAPGPGRTRRRRDRATLRPTRTSCASASTIAASATRTRPANRCWDELWGLENTGPETAAIPERRARPMPTSTPARRSASRPAIRRRSSRSSMTASTSPIPTLPTEPGRTPANRATGRETNGIDDDGNGYIDDVHGWDFCHDDNTRPRLRPGRPRHPRRGHDRGIAERHRRRRRRTERLDHGPEVHQRRQARDCGLDSQAIAAIEYAKSFGVHIVNASWGGCGDAEEGTPPVRRDQDLGDALRGRGRQRQRRQRHGPAPEPAGRIRPAEHPVGRRDRQHGRPRRVLELRQDDRRHRRARRRDPQRVAGRKPATRRACGPGWTAPRWRRHMSPARPPWSPRSSPRWPPIRTRSRLALLATGKPDAATAGMTVTGRVVDAVPGARHGRADRAGPVELRDSPWARRWAAPASRPASPGRAPRDDRSGVAAYGPPTAGRCRTVGHGRRVDDGAERDADPHVRDGVRLPRPSA